MIQNALSCRAPSNGFSKYSDEVEISGRNRLTFAVQAQVRLFGTSVSRNFWVLNGILRKSHFPPQATGEHFASSARGRLLAEMPLYEQCKL